MDIHVDIRGFLEIHAWICYGFSDQGSLATEKIGLNDCGDNIASSIFLHFIH